MNSKFVGRSLFILALASFGLAFAAFHAALLPGSPAVPMVPIDAAYAALQLFLFEGPVSTNLSPSQPAWSSSVLAIVRFTAPLSLAASLVLAFSQQIERFLRYQKASLHKEHDLVFGFGEFAENVIIERTQSCLRLGNPNGLEVDLNTEEDRGSRLVRSQIRKAKRIFLLSDDDQTNLRWLHIVKKYLVEDREVQDKRIVLRIENFGLRSSLINKPEVLNVTENLPAELVSVSELAARRYFLTRNFFADLLSQEGDQLHLVVWGYDAYTVGLIKQLVQVSPSPGLKTLKISLCSGASANSKALPNLGKLSELEIVEDCDLSNLSAHDIQRLSEVTPITHVLVSGRVAEDFPGSLYRLDILKRQLGYNWSVPILTGDEFVSEQITDKTSDQTLFERLTGNDLLDGFEDLVVKTDQYAAYLHASYQAKADVSNEVAAMEWRALNENFRRSNRRGADHAKTKMEALGVLDVLPGTKGVFQGRELDPSTLEKLAEAEHKSWMADRILNGWIYDEQRDNTRLLHPNLVEYAALDELTKQLDRDQVLSLISSMEK